MIRTARLRLVPATVEMLRADLARDLERLGRLVGAAAPAVWPPELFDGEAIRYSIEDLESDPRNAHWSMCYFVREGAPGEIVGVGGYKGAPLNGEVELGYSVLPAFRRQGYASEAVRGLVTRAFAYKEVERVSAHTLPELTASIGVLEKCGFRHVGPGEEAGTLRFERRRFSLPRFDAPKPPWRRASRPRP